MLFLPEEQKTASGRAGFELTNANKPLLVTGLFVALKTPKSQRPETKEAQYV